MTPLPDWLVERAALDEVPAASRERVERAEPRELADRVAALRQANADELARHPAAPAIAQIQERAAAEARRIAARRRVRWSALGLVTSAAALVLVLQFGRSASTPSVAPAPPEDTTRVKGITRLVAFRQVGDQAERLERDALVRAGDVIQLRYHPGGKRYGVIASLDGAGVVTLHFPASEEAPAAATALAAESAALPHAYELDDAPRFERFFFITSNEPIDLPQSLAALRALAHRDDSADAALELPAGQSQWSLRLRKPDAPSPHHESP